MPSLQIRKLPEDVYASLAAHAHREGRSLAQQAIVELRRIPEVEARQQRQELIARLRERARGSAPKDLAAPEDLVREDRDR